MVAAPKKKPEDLIIKQIIIHLRFTEKEYEEFKQYCYERNMNMSAFVRSLIKNAIKQSKK
ncbi:hypothetical protein [Spiroplasma ixodetis]|uniref:CopG family transcriptional regulator n=1 Tax=Spiroplasma ixodetis TaxID=2141 RepID=A0ABN6T0Y1_9MOLU|nr:hypothetical protein [Spiroplasma ixodetis]BDT05074.1 hypothetical protein SHM_27200 [Spiroplasma ixodetis]